MKQTLVAVITLALLAACQTTSSATSSTNTMIAQPKPNDDAPMNVNEWAAASRLLTRAAQLVRERGFQQGSLVTVSTVCMATALERAFYEGGYTIVDFNYAREALSRVLNVPRDPAATVDDPLDVPYWGRHLMEWNDTPGRTADDAIQAFETASRTALQLREAAMLRLR